MARYEDPTARGLDACPIWTSMFPISRQLAPNLRIGRQLAAHLSAQGIDIGGDAAAPTVLIDDRCPSCAYTRPESRCTEPESKEKRTVSDTTWSPHLLNNQ